MPIPLVHRPEITLGHEDDRGEMYSISLPGDRELMLLHSKKGSLRGGHSHDVPESVMVLTGKMLYRKLPPAYGPWEPAVRSEILHDGGCSRNPAGENHMGEFLEDTWLIEWKTCKDKHSWKNQNYSPWREKVEANAGA